MEDQYPARRRGAQAAAGVPPRLAAVHARHYRRAVGKAVCAIGRKSRPGDRAVAHSRGARSRVAVRHPPPVGKRRRRRTAYRPGGSASPASAAWPQRPRRSSRRGPELRAQAASTGRLSGRVTTCTGRPEASAWRRVCSNSDRCSPAASANPAFNLLPWPPAWIKRSPRPAAVMTMPVVMLEVRVCANYLLAYKLPVFCKCFFVENSLLIIT